MNQYVSNGPNFVDGVPSWGNVTITTTSGGKLWFSATDAATVVGWANASGFGYAAYDQPADDKETHPTTSLPPHH